MSLFRNFRPGACRALPGILGSCAVACCFFANLTSMPKLLRKFGAQQPWPVTMGWEEHGITPARSLVIGDAGTDHGTHWAQRKRARDQPLFAKPCSMNFGQTASHILECLLPERCRYRRTAWQVPLAWVRASVAPG